MGCIIPIGSEKRSVVNFISNYIYGNHDKIYLIKKEIFGSGITYPEVEKEIKFYHGMRNTIPGNLELLHDATSEVNILNGLVSRRYTERTYNVRFTFLENYFNFENGIKVPMTNEDVCKEFVAKMWREFRGKGYFDFFQKMRGKDYFSLVDFTEEDYTKLAESFISKGDCPMLGAMLLSAQYSNRWKKYA